MELRKTIQSMSDELEERQNILENRKTDCDRSPQSQPGNLESNLDLTTNLKNGLISEDNKVMLIS